MESSGKFELRKVGGEFVPSWDGNAERFEEYQVRAQIYVNGVESWRQPQRISNLVQALQGTAWGVILNLSESERENLQKTFRSYIDFLKLSCTETAVPQLGRRFREWQKFRRLKGESMRVYCRRYRTQLGKLETSMKQVENPGRKLQELTKHINKHLKLIKLKLAATPKRRNWRSRGSRVDEGEDEEEQEEEESEEQEWTEEEEERESARGSATKEWWEKWTPQEWEEWNKKHGYEEQKDKRVLVPIEELAEAFAVLEANLGSNHKDLNVLKEIVTKHWRPEPLPTILAGYHLLHGANLTATERSSLIATAAMGKQTETLGAVTHEQVEKSLILTWQDAELKERDEKQKKKEGKRAHHKRAFELSASDLESEANNLSESSSGADNTAHHMSDQSDSELEAQLLNELSDDEDRTALAEALIAKHDAKTQIKSARRSYAQAKATVREIKKTRRKFFPRNRNAHSAMANSFQRKDKRAQFPKKVIKTKTKLPCFRCGKTDHLIADCPNPPPSNTGHYAERDLHVVLMIKEEDSESEEERRLELEVKKLEEEAARVEQARLVEKKRKEREERVSLLKSRKAELEEKLKAESTSSGSQPIASTARSKESAPKFSIPASKAMPRGSHHPDRAELLERVKEEGRKRLEEKLVKEQSRSSKDTADRSKERTKQQESPMPKRGPTKAKQYSSSPERPKRKRDRAERSETRSKERKIQKKSREHDSSVERHRRRKERSRSTPRRKEKSRGRSRSMQRHRGRSPTLRRQPRTPENPPPQRAIIPPSLRPVPRTPPRGTGKGSSGDGSSMWSYSDGKGKGKSKPHGQEPVKGTGKLGSKEQYKGKDSAKGKGSGKESEGQNKVKGRDKNTKVKGGFIPPTRRRYETNADYRARKRNDKERYYVSTQCRFEKDYAPPVPLSECFHTADISAEMRAAKDLDENYHKREARRKLVKALEQDKELAKERKVIPLRRRIQVLNTPRWPKVCKGQFAQFWHESFVEEERCQEAITMLQEMRSTHVADREEEYVIEGDHTRMEPEDIGQRKPKASMERVVTRMAMDKAGLTSNLIDKVQKLVKGEAVDCKEANKVFEKLTDNASGQLAVTDDSDEEGPEESESEDDDEEKSPRQLVVEEAEARNQDVFMLSQEVNVVGSNKGVTQLITIDCGASGTLMSSEALERHVNEGFVEILSITAENRKKYKVANGAYILTSTEAEIHLTNFPELGDFKVDIVEGPESSIPSLLGMNVLKTSMLDMSHSTLHINGKRVPLVKKGNGHLAIDLTRKSNSNLEQLRRELSQSGTQRTEVMATNKNVVVHDCYDDDDDELVLDTRSHVVLNDCKHDQKDQEYESDEELIPAESQAKNRNDQPMFSSKLVEKCRSILREVGTSRSSTLESEKSNGNRAEESRDRQGAQQSRRAMLGRIFPSGTDGSQEEAPRDRVRACTIPEEGGRVHEGSRRTEEGHVGKRSGRTWSNSHGHTDQGRSVADSPGEDSRSRSGKDEDWKTSRPHIRRDHREPPGIRHMGCERSGEGIHEQRRDHPVGNADEGDCQRRTQGSSSRCFQPKVGIRVWRRREEGREEREHIQGCEAEDGNQGEGGTGVGRRRGAHFRRELDKDQGDQRVQGQGLHLQAERQEVIQDSETTVTGPLVSSSGKDGNVLDGTQLIAKDLNVFVSQIQCVLEVADVNPTARVEANVLDNLAEVCLTGDTCLRLSKEAAELDSLESKAEANVEASHDQDLSTYYSEWENARKTYLAEEFYSTSSMSEVNALRAMISDLKQQRQKEKVGEKRVTRVIEFCCSPTSEIGEQAKSLEVEVLRCTDTPGEDVMTKAGLERCERYARSNPGCHLFGSLPCTAWSSLQNLNVHLHGESFKERLKADRDRSLRLVGNFLHLARIVKQGGGTVSFEWPRHCSGWRANLVLRMIKELSMEKVEIDGCTLGVKSLKTDKPIKKPWSIATTCSEMQQEFQNSRCQRDHEHTPCEGSDTKQTGFYTPKMARKILKSILRHDVQKLVQQRKAVMAAEQKEVEERVAATATKEEIKAFLELPAKQRQELVEAARKVHINTGHKPVSELARLLRREGAPPQSRAAMEQVKCSTCLEHRRPEPSPVASLSTSAVPFKVIGIDMKEISTQVGKTQIFDYSR